MRVTDEMVVAACETHDINYGAGDSHQKAMRAVLEQFIAALSAEGGAAADGSMTVDEAITAVLDLFPGADRQALAVLARALTKPAAAATGDWCHKLDTLAQVFFYEQDFYVLSNFSAFSLQWKGRRFDTSEAAYHWEKFPDAPDVQDIIRHAPSAHEAFKLAETHKWLRRPDWDAVKLDVMREILREKAAQHEYVRRKLLATGTRELVEDSWRDDYWGWGPNRDGQNWLGRLWMEVRTELASKDSP